ncbi:hypothetical protein VOLCADRAFT_96065 [Volvox carteri f. nagariensis]|uniref:Uncharacterized protein n=1 Tax=Volvox carteri f. nagariensis TaxID=3068 RepID=D8U942_VOLCA|nr:uncharacterized protein VOLCADRAFT_96065 [Volvox carteri f. nagariensis]EFJ43685.1 hypothetical protein VOLCADRAFT_96065 [Volvox carteri f. nagariensis]|eukprot:XP_002955166.1 hypothetical protein VOLCADRAFT_96065 [Volvox carteri f. nagariensis]
MTFSTELSLAAGTPSLKPHKGTGSFVMQSTWSLGVVPNAGGTGTSAATGGSGDGAAPGPSSAAAAAATTSRWAAVSAAAGGGPVTAGLPPRSYSTETKFNYGPPPSDFRRTRSAGPPVSQFPKPGQPNDWK